MMRTVSVIVPSVAPVKRWKRMLSKAGNVLGITETLIHGE